MGLVQGRACHRQAGPVRQARSHHDVSQGEGGSLISSETQILSLGPHFRLWLGLSVAFPAFTWHKVLVLITVTGLFTSWCGSVVTMNQELSLF